MWTVDLLHSLGFVLVVGLVALVGSGYQDKWKRVKMPQWFDQNRWIFWVVWGILYTGLVITAILQYFAVVGPDWLWACLWYLFFFNLLLNALWTPLFHMNKWAAVILQAFMLIFIFAYWVFVWLSIWFGTFLTFELGLAFAIFTIVAHLLYFVWVAAAIYIALSSEVVKPKSRV